MPRLSCSVSVRWKMAPLAARIAVRIRSATWSSESPRSEPSSRATKRTGRQGALSFHALAVYERPIRRLEVHDHPHAFATLQFRVSRRYRRVREDDIVVI